jgi:hypothetical protein
VDIQADQDTLLCAAVDPAVGEHRSDAVAVTKLQFILCEKLLTSGEFLVLLGRRFNQNQLFSGERVRTCKSGNDKQIPTLQTLVAEAMRRSCRSR